MLTAHLGRYKRLEAEEKKEEDEDVDNEASASTVPHGLHDHNCLPFSTMAIIMMALVLVIIAMMQLPPSPDPECRNPPTRQEWRALSRLEQKGYIQAVQCLMQRPSAISPNTSVFDDFAYTHSRSGASSHYKTSFLAWHRYLVLLYEQALKRHCGYSGVHPYWDWTIDADDLARSPLWDADNGFGANGVEERPGVVRGNCVVDGPFASTDRYWIDFDNGTLVNRPHCLSRGFASGEARSYLQRVLKPTFVESLLDAPTYDSFFATFENTTHNAIPSFIGGDFAMPTAPNDPVFFLHHTQVDRLWWLWQQRDPKTRLHPHRGRSRSRRQALEAKPFWNETLHYGPLAEAVLIEDVVSTTSNMLCYSY